MNFETAPVHPVALAPDGRTLAVCNLPDGRVEFFDVSSGIPRAQGSVAVGVDPVSVRFRDSAELWVVNHISSSVSIVDMNKRRVKATLNTLAGPADIVFAGNPVRAFVSCPKEDTVQVFDPVQRQVITNLVIEGDRPKALAVSPDGTRVYAAIFESGNASTILGQGAVTHAGGPYGGQNPPPNDGPDLNPPLYRDPAAEARGFDYIESLHDRIIVKRNADGRWMDDNDGDWTELIRGTNATYFGRSYGWDMPDRDLAIINTASFDITYATGLMNICMALAVNPVSGKIAVVGTDGTNERRFEPMLRGTFLRVNLALVDPLTLSKTIRDLNPHLDYSTSSVPVSVRDLSLGDPRGTIWNAAGTRGYVTGMGSRNLVVIDSEGQRLIAHPVELDEGPTGLALDEPRNRLYVLNRFSATLSTIDAATLTVITNIGFFDPTPLAIKAGRKHLYDTRRTSGLGHVSCGSCHVDARFDRLAWDLGNPAGPTIMDSAIFHPMKGPLVTQTLQDIFAEPAIGLHWRADRGGIETFNITFTDLLGADQLLTTNEMQEFKDFLATIHFPPNRFRNFDNSLPTSVTPPPMSELGLGNAVRGREIFMRSASCGGCHNLASGLGTFGDSTLGERFATPVKVAQLRSVAEKVGMSRTGFGLGFDGIAESLREFVRRRDLSVPRRAQAMDDVGAFLLAFTGAGSQDEYRTTQDAPAAVGHQITITSAAVPARLHEMLALADLTASRVDLIARGAHDTLERAWFYDRSTGRFQSDRNGEQMAPNTLLALASNETPVTFTVVPASSGSRLGVDRDEDGYFDRTEIETGLDPADPLSRGSNAPPRIVTPPPIRVHPGMPVAHTFSAIDDVPAQTLTFTLTREVPPGSSFDPATGTFSWTPASDEPSRVWHVGVRATDDGIPPLSAHAALEISVLRPAIKRLLFGLDNIGSPGVLVIVDAVPDFYYVLEYKQRLDDPAWTTTGHRTYGYAPEIELYDDHEFALHTQRFYRITISQGFAVAK